MERRGGEQPPLPQAGEGRGEGAYIPTPAKKLPPDLRTFARNLRASQTDAEALLWGLIRNRRLLGFKFRRQYPLDAYILDFFCLDAALAIELDGGQHAEQQSYDDKRTRHLESRGVTVLRFWNNEMLQQTESVLEKIYLTLASRTPSSPTLLPPAGEGSQNLREGE
ncbi:MAG: endonuclease domain-containing protein [Sulfuricella sp.]|nr:endonuclease domain-containing protein [Sulfuricella sp.]